MQSKQNHAWRRASGKRIAVCIAVLAASLLFILSGLYARENAPPSKKIFTQT